MDFFVGYTCVSIWCRVIYGGVHVFATVSHAHARGVFSYVQVLFSGAFVRVVGNACRLDDDVGYVGPLVHFAPIAKFSVGVGLRAISRKEYLSLVRYRSGYRIHYMVGRRGYVYFQVLWYSNLGRSFYAFAGLLYEFGGRPRSSQGAFLRSLLFYRGFYGSRYYYRSRVIATNVRASLVC